MKAMLLYSHNSGHGQLKKHHDEILLRLRKKFGDVEEVVTESVEEGQKEARRACREKDVLIIAGGDGTFNLIVNAIAEEEKRPILAYINNGTIGDIGHNFGIGRSYKKALKVIEKGEPVPFDIARINDRYFCYVAAVGAYSDIPYVTERKYKKALGVVAYYTKALGEVVKPKKVKATIIADGKEYEVVTPFVLLMNGVHVGGFMINNRGNIFDGVMELWLAKPGLFNGLLHFMFARDTIRVIKAKEFQIHTDQAMPWDLDGEEGPRGDIHAKCLHNHLMIYSLKKGKKVKDK